MLLRPSSELLYEQIFDFIANLHNREACTKSTALIEADRAAVREEAEEQLKYRVREEITLVMGYGTKTGEDAILRILDLPELQPRIPPPSGKAMAAAREWLSKDETKLFAHEDQLAEGLARIIDKHWSAK